MVLFFAVGNEIAESFGAALFILEEVEPDWCAEAEPTDPEDEDAAGLKKLKRLLLLPLLFLLLLPVTIAGDDDEDGGGGKEGKAVEIGGSAAERPRLC